MDKKTVIKVIYFFHFIKHFHYVFITASWMSAENLSLVHCLKKKSIYLFIFVYLCSPRLAKILFHSSMSENFPYLAATSSPITHGSDVNCPGAINGWGQQVSAATLEMEVLSVKRAVVASAPGHTGSRAQRHSGTSQKATTHQWGKLGVWSGGG